MVLSIIWKTPFTKLNICRISAYVVVSLYITVIALLVGFCPLTAGQVLESASESESHMWMMEWLFFQLKNFDIDEIP